VTRNVLVHVGVDDVEVGRVAARFIIERLGNKGRVIELEGHYGTPGAVDRRTGFDQVMKKSSVKVVASQTASWSRAKAQDLMQVFIESYPKFDAVFAANDEMILGAIAAMEAANIDPASKVTVGVDASADALQYVKDGKLTATIGVAPDKQAVRAIDCLATFIDNKTRPPQPIVLLKPELIRKAP